MAMEDRTKISTKGVVKVPMLVVSAFTIIVTLTQLSTAQSEIDVDADYYYYDGEATEHRSINTEVEADVDWIEVEPGYRCDVSLQEHLAPQMSLWGAGHSVSDCRSKCYEQEQCYFFNFMWVKGYCHMFQHCSMIETDATTATYFKMGATGSYKSLKDGTNSLNQEDELPMLAMTSVPESVRENEDQVTIALDVRTELPRNDLSIRFNVKIHETGESCGVHFVPVVAVEVAIVERFGDGDFTGDEGAEGRQLIAAQGVEGGYVVDAIGEVVHRLAAETRTQLVSAVSRGIYDRIIVHIPISCDLTTTDSLRVSAFLVPLGSLNWGNRIKGGETKRHVLAVLPPPPSQSPTPSPSPPSPSPSPTIEQTRTDAVDRAGITSPTVTTPTTTVTSTLTSTATTSMTTTTLESTTQTTSPTVITPATTVASSSPKPSTMRSTTPSVDTTLHVPTPTNTSEDKDKQPPTCENFKSWVDPHNRSCTKYRMNAKGICESSHAPHAHRVHNAHRRARSVLPSKSNSTTTYTASQACCVCGGGTAIAYEINETTALNSDYVFIIAAVMIIIAVISIPLAIWKLLPGTVRDTEREQRKTLKNLQLQVGSFTTSLNTVKEESIDSTPLDRDKEEFNDPHTFQAYWGEVAAALTEVDQTTIGVACTSVVPPKPNTNTTATGVDDHTAGMFGVSKENDEGYMYVIRDVATNGSSPTQEIEDDLQSHGSLVESKVGQSRPVPYLPSLPSPAYSEKQDTANSGSLW